MSINTIGYKNILEELNGKANLIAVSKIKPIQDIQAMYNLGQRDFGENYVQEIVDKQSKLPADINWHFIGHLQSNKVKYIAPFIHLIHGVDSYNLLKEINKQALKNNRIINCLLQVHIAEEETKFGFAIDQIENQLPEFFNLKNVQIKGLMGMASFSENIEMVQAEFKSLQLLFDKVSIQQPTFNILSMGMSGDYKIAVQEGSNMVRIGSLLFGSR